MFFCRWKEILVLLGLVWTSRKGGESGQFSPHPNRPSVFIQSIRTESSCSLFLPCLTELWLYWCASFDSHFSLYRCVNLSNWSAFIFVSFLFCHLFMFCWIDGFSAFPFFLIYWNVFFWMWRCCHLQPLGHFQHKHSTGGVILVIISRVSRKKRTATLVSLLNLIRRL